MKNSILIIAFLLINLVCKAQSIYYPIVEQQDAKSIIIEKVEFTKNNTVIYLKHYADNEYIDGGWVSISKDTYIKAKGSSTKLKLIKANGIPISPKKHQYSTKDDELIFELIFPKIENNQIIDLIECEGKNNCFNFYNISLNKNDIGITQTIFYDKNWTVVKKKDAKFYATYIKGETGRIIDYIRFYNLNENSLMRKYKGKYVSNISFAYDIIDGEEFFYDKFGNIRRKIQHINPNKLRLIDYLKNKNDIVYDFDTKGNLIQYSEFKNGTKSKLIKYNTNQEITYAIDLNDDFFYQGNPTVGYELTYYESFENSNPIIGEVKDYKSGKRSFVDGSYLMESKTFGGLVDVLDVDFDMNNSDWVVMTTFDRIASIEGAGITMGVNSDVSSFQMFLISGDKYFNHYNIFNGFNISTLKDWMYSKDIKGFNDRNLLSVLKIKNKIFVSVNGKRIYQSDFTKLSSNTVGLIVDKIGNKIKFENFTIKKLDAEIPSKFFNPKNYITSNSTFKGNGTGFTVNSFGYIATNYHVIDGAKEIYVEIDGLDKKCNLIAVDKENDLAIIKPINVSKLDVYSKLSSEKSDTGNDIFVLGYPYALSLLGNEIKLTDGKISSQSGFQGNSKTYQISAPIQPGNSGGPLFNKNGDIIGIISSKFTAGENVGYAIKMSYLINLLKSNNIQINTQNIISNLSFVEKVKKLSKTTILIKVK